MVNLHINSDLPVPHSCICNILHIYPMCVGTVQVPGTQDFPKLNQWASEGLWRGVS